MYKDTYFIFQKKYLRVYENSFGAKILRDDFALNTFLAYVCACFVRSFNALLLAPIVAKSWGNPINFFYFWLCSLLPRRRFLLESHHSWPCPIPLIDLRKESFSQSLLSSNQISRCFHWGLTRPISVITFSPLGITTY